MGTLSAPGFITGRFHDPDTFSHKDNDSGRRMEGVGCQDDTINALGGFA